MFQPKDFSRLHGSLRGISDRSLSQHLELYRQAVTRLNAIEAAYPLTDWKAQTGAGGHSRVDARSILGMRIRDLDLHFEGQIAECLKEFRGELEAKGIRFFPNFYLGEPDFWATDKGCSINLPWYLANPTLWRLANRQAETTYTVDQVMRCLRHETGHTVNYAFELWKTPEWMAHFGNMDEPYRDVFPSDPRSEDFVEYLTGVSAHYAQKHPDEDFAETFARWLDPLGGWQEEFSGWPVALGKLQYIEDLAGRGRLRKQTNFYPGQIVPYRALRASVGGALGTAEGVQPYRGIEGWSEHAELLRREPHAYNAVLLHEVYFSGLGRITAPEPGPSLLAAAQATWGSWESYILDLRLIAAAAGNGWALTVFDPVRGRLRNALVEGDASGIPAGCPIVLALDCHEHAYALDYGNRRDVGIAAWFENIEWATVEVRMIGAMGDSRFVVPPPVERKIIPALVEIGFSFDERKPDEEDFNKWAQEGAEDFGDWMKTRAAKATENDREIEKALAETEPVTFEKLTPAGMVPTGNEVFDLPLRGSSDE